MDHTHLARRMSRLLELSPQARLAVAIDAADPLHAAVISLLSSAGAAVHAEGPVDAAVVAVKTVPDAMDLHGLRAVHETISRVVPGGRVAIAALDEEVFDGAEEHQNRLAQRVGPCLELAQVHAERLDGALIVSGTRWDKLPNAKLKRLRGLGHDIVATVLVGRAGLTDEIIAAASDAVQRHGLIKVKLTPQATLDKVQASRDLAWATGSRLVQRVGKTALLYRSDVKLDPPQKARRH